MSKARYDQMVAAGRCPRCETDLPPDCTTVCCPACLASHPFKRTYRQRVMAGLCPYCGVPIPRHRTAISCLSCTDYRRDWQREATQSARSYRCRSCGENGHNVRTCADREAER